MAGLLLRLAALAKGQAVMVRRDLSRRAGLGAAMVASALFAAGTALALAGVLLARQIGVVWTLTAGIGVGLLGCLVVWAMMRAAAQRAQAARQQAEAAFLREILAAVLPLARRAPPLAVALAILAGIVLSGGKDGDGEDGDGDGAA